MKFFGKLRRLTSIILALVNVAMVLALLATGYAGVFNPARHPSTEILVLAFPLPLVINVAFLVFWLLFNYKYAIIPLVGFLLCWGPIRNYCPVNFSSNECKDGIKVTSFNICSLVKVKTHVAVDFFANLNSDILCLQEVPPYKDKYESFCEEMKPLYPYYEMVDRHQMERICVYSKYPILKKELLPIESKKNNCAAFFLDVDGDTVLVLNVHFETVGLQLKERKKIESIIKQKEIDSKERSIVRKICESAARRAPQVDMVADYMQKYKDMPTILCGDFNDVPNTYAYRRVEEYLDNCFRAKATGPGFSYNQYDMLVRIDNIFCSDDWETCSCKIDSKINISDHYPVIATIKKRTNP